MYIEMENRELKSKGADIEIWKDVVGYEGFYQVSSLGRIRSYDRHVNHNYGGMAIKKGKILSQTDNSSGYLSVGLTKYNRTRTTRVNRIVAKAFIPNPENKPQVNHRDGSKHNNIASNLEWATASENVIHSWRNGLCEKSNYKEVVQKTKEILRYIGNDFFCQTPIGIGRIIIDDTRIRIAYDNGRLENLIKAVRQYKHDFKILLRPLSDLYRAITHNGEEIVPIVKLAKMADVNLRFSGNWRFVEDRRMAVNVDNQFYFDKGTFRCVIDSGSKLHNNTIFNQYQLFDYLHELKIDYRGLIDAGLAKPVYDLDENPYK